MSSCGGLRSSQYQLEMSVITETWRKTAADPYVADKIHGGTLCWNVIWLSVWILQGEELLEFISQAQNNDARGWLHEAMGTLRHGDLVRPVITFLVDLVCKTEGDEDTF